MKYIILLFVILLAGCNTVNPTVTKQVVVIPPNTLYDCPIYKDYPNWKTLTDPQVARVIVQLYRNNIRCKNSIDHIKLFLEQSKHTIEE